VSEVWDLIWPGPRDPLVDVADHDLRRVATLNVLRCFSRGSRLPLNISWGLLRNRRRRLRRQLVRTPSSGRRRVGAVNRSSHRRLDWTSRRGRLGISPISIFLILLDKNALTDLLNTYTFKDRNQTRHGLVEDNLTGLYNSVSFKVKYTISMRIWNIIEKNTIRGSGLKFIQITLFQNEALASKHSKMAYLGWSSESQLIRSLFF
jgi:hypothetical protein